MVLVLHLIIAADESFAADESAARTDGISAKPYVRYKQCASELFQPLSTTNAHAFFANLIEHGGGPFTT
eukprot:scaffold280730_cov48-Prasinocladus_malaysianus.AAC.1